MLTLWSLILLSGFGVALALEPDSRGFGTHEQLGLPPCTVRMISGLPCPSCGMTTSFSHFVQGEFVQAARANFAGLVLAVVCAAQIPWCWISVRQRRLWKVSRPETGLIWLLAVLCAAGFLQWAVRLWNGL